MINTINKIETKILFLDKDNLLSHLNKYDYIFMITHKKIEELITKSMFCDFQYKTIFIDEGESTKNLSTIESIINELALFGCNRNSLVIGLGGGVVSDITGFIASIYMRGINHILIPTTLLGMVDAAIGGKTGINFQNRKNLIGTFKQPENIYIDLSFLDSLDNKEILNGFSEIVKYGLIYDKNLFFELVDNFNQLISLQNIDKLKEIIIQCYRFKEKVVAKDQFDKGERMILNFGHTVGHALESYYKDEGISHGDAIYYGMIVESYISYKIGLLKIYEFKKINKFISSIQKFEIKGLNIDKLLNYIKMDKKQSIAQNRFILLNGIGNGVIKNNIEKEIIKEALDKI
tara:strand:+ start:729 stop:1769 length:1041 start_codon:yes stop_codon:yes gene_type:complete